jgi:hypothetical protein
MFHTIETMELIEVMAMEKIRIIIKNGSAHVFQ